MESYQERVVEELVALNYKIIALRDFLPSECFASLDQDEQFRLMEQLYHMQEYGKILQERVNAWSDQKSDFTIDVSFNTDKLSAVFDEMHNNIKKSVNEAINAALEFN